MCANSAERSFVANPTAAFALKYCAVTALMSPTAARSTSTSPILMIWAVSLCAMPRSMMDAMTSGTISSKEASSILNSGARMLSFL